jgi:predicted enzyme related to lactoylglutathione lyase
LLTGVKEARVSVRWYTVVVDCHDVAAQVRWWAEVLGWTIAFENGSEAVIVPPYALDENVDIPVERRGPGIVFVPVPETKTLKNRLHIDLAPRAADDQAAEVARLEAMGATRVDVGQGDDVGWIVLADPEGNEFCVLSPRD